MQWRLLLNQYPVADFIIGIVLMLVGAIGFIKARLVLIWLDKWRRAKRRPAIGASVGVPLIKGVSFLIAFLGLISVILATEITN